MPRNATSCGRNVPVMDRNRAKMPESMRPRATSANSERPSPTRAASSPVEFSAAKGALVCRVLLTISSAIRISANCMANLFFSLPGAQVLVKKRKPGMCPGLYFKWSFPFQAGGPVLAAGSQGCNPVDESTEDQIGNEGEYDSHDEDTGDINTMKDNVLIDSIENRRDDEYLADMVPRFLHQTLAASGHGDKFPEIWLAGFPGISQSGAYAKEDGYRRLQKQPEIHGPSGAANEVLPKVSERFSHCITPCGCS